MKNLPPGVRTVETGDSEFMAEIFSGFAIAMLVGIFCIYALLVLLFHDVLQPITILSALPPSIGGAIVALFIFQMELSLPALLGVLALMGIVTKNSILLVEYAVMARREHGLNRLRRAGRRLLQAGAPHRDDDDRDGRGHAADDAGFVGRLVLQRPDGRLGHRRADCLDRAVAVRRAGDLHAVRRRRALDQEEILPPPTVDSSRGCFVA